MSHIHVLDSYIANRIAAGEVVERPASVVKELVENSIDAGATSITIETTGGGFESIRVTDNGSGIAIEDAATAFLPHATSKISTSDDLLAISTLGFRGEALPSIAAVSKVTLRSKRAEAQNGVLLRINGGEIIENHEAGVPDGTTIECNDLFYNVPARLKFTKSARTETANITDYVCRMVMARPDIKIKLIQSGKTTLQSNGNGSMEDAIASVYSSYILKDLRRISYDDGYVSIEGYIGAEKLGKATRAAQSFYVNGRYIKSQKLSFALQRAYDTRIMQGRFPLAVLHINISPEEVDVNVHPNKLEVRFRQEDRIVAPIVSQCRHALEAAALITEEYNETEQENDISQETVSENKENETCSKHEENNEPIEHNSHIEYTQNVQKAEYVQEGLQQQKQQEQEHNQQQEQKQQQEQESESYEYKPIRPEDIRIRAKIDKNAAFADDGADRLRVAPRNRDELMARVPYGFKRKAGEDYMPIPASIQQKKPVMMPVQSSINFYDYKIIGQVFDCYWAVQRGDELFFIDQHAMHERQIYENISRHGINIDSQRLLLPMIIELPPLEVDTVLENEDSFTELGFDICKNDDRSICVMAIPNMLESRSSIKKFLLETIQALETLKISGSDLKRNLMIRFACKAAIKSGDRISNAEVKSLLDVYDTRGIPLVCPHGRPVMMKMSKAAFEKAFKRDV